MSRNLVVEQFRRGTAFLLCLLLSALCPAAHSSDRPDREPAGKITGVSSSASEDGAAAALKDLVRTNELLSTNKSGRLRVQLDDGSILSIGSESQIRVAKHDASTGETLINLTSGRLRSRVVKIRKSGTRFQVLTPQARISVVGTDFFLEVSPARTQVVVYTGIVLVGATAGGSPVDVAAGQTTTVDHNGISRLILTAEDYERQTIAETALPNEMPAITSEAASTESAQKPHSHLRRNLVIGAAIAGGALAAGLAARGGSSSSTQSSSQSQSTIPSIPPH
jgi:ferric-dicitrate binding protein FerR (iron transport regulator)